MPASTRRTLGPSLPTPIGPALVCLGLALIFAAAIAWPALIVALELARAGPARPAADSRDFFGPGTLAMLVRTFAAAAVVSLAAVAVAYPAAWAIRSHRAILPFLLIPLFLPSYVAYAGWGVLRAPGTRLAAWIARGSVDALELKTRLAYDLQAVLGLSLWAWPIAAVVIAAGLTRLDPDLLDTLRLEPASARRRGLTLLNLTRAPILWAFAIIFVLMLGSAVPFHVAQLETYAIAIWRLIDLTAPADRWRVWVAASPLVLITLAIGAILARKLFSLADTDSQPAPVDAPPLPTRAGRLALAWTVLLWIAAVIVPVSMLATTMDEPTAAVRFAARHWPALRDTFATALIVAAVAWLITTAVWFLADRGSKASAVAAACVVLAIGVAPVPGLLVGLATARAWALFGATQPVADSAAVVVLAHTARFAFVPALAGWWLARTQTRTLRDLRRIDGADSLVGWFRSCFPTNAWVTLAAAAAVAMLSIQEIEASIMVIPPGYHSLAEWMLQQLHALRQDDLAAGALFLTVLAVATAIVIAACLRFGRPDPIRS